MLKRKRENGGGAGATAVSKSRKQQAASTPKHAHRKAAPAGKSSRESAANSQSVAGAHSNRLPASIAREGESERASFQIITGSYERVLHGFIATFPADLVTGYAQSATDDADKADIKTKDANTGNHAPISFSDTFLFNAHTSAIRCLALTPPSDESSKVLLATGSTDERINLYSLSTAPPAPSKSQPQLPSLHGTSITHNPKNKELGSLLHHSSSITALYFPTRSKLLSSAEDSTIAITRTRDWETLSTIKAPIPKPQGRPSGDTAAPGEVPAGINDFAVHPSMKLMVSIGKGEKCMRLWNLVTGKKAGVLNFSKDILAAVGEGRFGSGEGRAVTWDVAGDEFAVAFERGVVVFGIDCKPKAKIVPSPRTKVHRIHYLPSPSHPTTLMVSTEDGRVMLYDTDAVSAAKEGEDIPSGSLRAQIGGPAAGFTGRIKDFELLPAPSGDATHFLVFTGSSDGTVRIWSLDTEDLFKESAVSDKAGFADKQIGRLLGTYSTGTRITCLKVFAMTGQPEADEEELPNKESEASSSSENDDSS